MGGTVRAARAVDTATDPDHRRRGLFRTLTLDALDALAADGTRFVWNTPNSTSLAGYLTMGWQEVGRIPVVVAPASAKFPFVVLTARRAAGRDAIPTSFGRAVGSGVRGRSRGRRPLIPRKSLPVRDWPPTGRRRRSWRGGTTTPRSATAWCSTAPAELPASWCSGFAGAVEAVEAVLCDLFAPAGDPAVGPALVRSLARGTDADYVIRIPGRRDTASALFVYPGQVQCSLAARSMAPTARRPRPTEDGPPELGEWALTMGDVELL